MSTTMTGLPFVRFTRQVSTGPSAVIATAAMAESNALAIQSAFWFASTVNASTMPPLNFVTNPLQESYDAFKYASDYASGKQKAYAGMVAYRFTTPDDAITKTSDITSVAVSLFVDRWLIGGVRVAAYTSDSEEPSSVWTTLREGDIYDDAVLPAVSPRADQNTTVTLTFPGSTLAKKYIYLIISLEDYASTSPLDVRRIEGGSLIVGDNTVVIFDEDNVAADGADVVSFIVSSRREILEAHTPLTRTLLAYGTDGTPSYGRWQSALASFCNLSGANSPSSITAADSDRIGMIYKTVVWPGASSNVRMCTQASQHWRFGYISRSVRLRTLKFGVTIPAPSTSVIIRIVIYAVGGFPANNTTPHEQVLHNDSLRDINLWMGSATSAKRSDDAALTLTKIMDVSINKSYDTTYPWPVDYTAPAGAITLLIAGSVERLTDSPGTTQDDWYGIQWQPSHVTLAT